MCRDRVTTKLILVQNSCVGSEENAFWINEIKKQPPGEKVILKTQKFEPTLKQCHSIFESIMIIP
jgi:hypothetical protein